MTTDYSRIWPFFIAALAVFVIYRRFRRLFGRQPLLPTRMKVRIGIFLLVALGLAPVALKSGQFLVLELCGAAAGVALAFWGASRTRYEKRGDQLFYIPHTYTGIAVSLLVIGRLVYRAVQVYSVAHATAPSGSIGPPPGFGSSGMLRSPLTVGMLFVLIGYYVCYYSLVLRKSKHLELADLEPLEPA